MSDDAAAVRVRFLGSGDAFGSGGRFQTCIGLTGAGEGLLLDCGASSLVAMKRAGADPGGIGSVVVSHLHGDHYGGIAFMVLDGQFSGRSRPLRVAGPAGIGSRVAAAMEALFPGSAGARRRFAVEFLELEPGPARTVGDARVTVFPVQHPSGAPAHAVRVEYGGRIIAYSGDTEWTESLVDVSRDADLFVCEAYSFDRRIPYHLDYRSLDRERGRLTCRRLVLTHLGPEALRRRDEIPVECAEDGMEIVL